MSGNVQEINIINVPLEAKLNRLPFQSDLFSLDEITETNRKLNEERQGFAIIPANQVLINRPLLSGLPYFENPKNDNEVLLNAQYDFLIKGKNEAWGIILNLSFEIMYRLVKAYARDHKQYLDKIDLDEKTSKAVLYVLKRYKPEYGEQLPKKRRKNFYERFPLGQYYVTTNYIDFLKKGTVHAFLYTTKLEKNTTSLEALDERKI